MEHTTTVDGSSEHRLLIVQGWEQVAVYDDPDYRTKRAIMVRDRDQRAAIVAAENAGYARGYDTASRIYGAF